MSSSMIFLLCSILAVVMTPSLARKSDKGSSIIIISPPAPNPDPQPPPPPPPTQYMMHQFHMPPPPPPPTFAPPPQISMPYPLAMPSMSNFMHRSGLLSPQSLPPPMPSGFNRELLRSLLASSSMNMPSDYPMSDMSMESSMHSDSFMSPMDPHQKMLQALLPNFLVLPIKIPQGSFSGGRRGSRPDKIPKSIADLMANHMSMEESSKKESILNEHSSNEVHRRSSHSDNTMIDPNPTWEPTMEINEGLW